jgi:hypothetical protein
LTLRRSQIVIILLLVANLAGCTFAAYGAAIFCLAPTGTLEWFTIPYGLLLMLNIPVLIAAMFWDRIRILAAIVGGLCLVGLGAQQVLLDRNILHCDVP